MERTVNLPGIRISIIVIFQAIIIDQKGSVMIKRLYLFLLLSIFVLSGMELYGKECVDGQRLGQGTLVIIGGICVEDPQEPYPERYDCGPGKRLVQGSENFCIAGTETGDPGPYPPLPSCPLDQRLVQGSGLCADIPDLSLNLLSVLDDSIRESSGLAIVNGKLYTHNDSGGGNNLYEINASTGKVLRTITVNGAKNVDWEDLAVDENYLYIADTGNNEGSRTDLKIYRVPKSDLDTKPTVDAETIAFSYADQTKFDYDPHTTPYDAEALVAYKGELYIFTKNWADYTSRIYPLPSVPGTYALTSIGEKRLDVMVTGADIDEATGTVALVGYTNPFDTDTPYRSMIVNLSAFGGNDFFSGRIAEHPIKNSVGIGAVEAILFRTSAGFYLSAEGLKTQSAEYPAKLYETKINAW